MADSTIPACKTALLTILGARPALAAVNVSRSEPTKDEDVTNPRMIFLGAVESAENWSTLGAQRRRETYRLGITVYAEDWGDDPDAAETAAFGLWAEVTDGLRDDLRAQPSTLRTAGVQQYDDITFRQTTGPASAEKWGARIDGQITFTATTV
jgi:hypothetical protein